MKSVLVNVGKSLMNAESGCMGSVEKSIAGYRFLKTSKLSDYLNKSFAKAAHEWSASYALAGFLSTLPRVIFEALLVCIAMIALFGPADYSYGSGDSLLLLTALTVRVIPSAARISHAIQQIQFSAAPTQAVMEFLSIKRIEDDVERTFVNCNGVEIEYINLLIEQNVKLSCSSFKIRPGENILLTGKSGCGKVFLDTLVGLTNPRWILKSFGKHGSRSDFQHWMLNNVSYCAQDEKLFEASVSENIFGFRDTKVSNEHLILIYEILRQSSIKRLI